MKNLAKIRDEHEGAFTLVELLVVILIIGILAAIAIPAFLNQRKAAVDSSVESDVKNASTQVETWAVSNANKTVPNFTLTADAEGNVTKTYQNGTTAVQVDGPLGDIKIGEGTKLTIAAKGTTEKGAYTIIGSNADGSRSVDNPTTADVQEGISFDSTAGGLQ